MPAKKKNALKKEDKLIDEKKALAFLKKGVKNLRHSNKDFIDHLKNTGLLLKAWKLPQNVYMAGYFHSIYGTEFYEIEISFKRTDIQPLIGKYAERLVHLFCTLQPRLTSIISPKTPLTDQERFDLMCIEWANLLEIISFITSDNVQSYVGDLLLLILTMQRMYPEKFLKLSAHILTHKSFILKNQ